MRNAFVIVVVTMLTTYLLAADIVLSISPPNNGHCQIVAFNIPNKLSHQTVYVLQSSTDCVSWTGVVTNRGLIPPWTTNTVYSTNVMTFYRASVTYEPDQ
jgi:hypothetical protein